MSFIRDMERKNFKTRFLDLTKLKQVVNGYEGCEKSRTIIELSLESFNGSVIYACKAYSMLKDKQSEIMEKFSLTEREVPIVALQSHSEYLEYYTTPKYPFQIPTEAKIILITQAALMKEQLNNILSRSSYKPIIKLIILDEFDPSIGIIPSIHVSQNTFWDETLKNDTDRTISNEKFLKKLKNEYSKNDFTKQLSNFQSGNNNEPLIANWILDAELHKIKIAVLTSETLATKLLSSIGFEELTIDYHSDFSNDIINICFEKNIIKQFFSRVNSELAWKHLGFNTIISDNHKDVEEVKVETKSTIDVVNHSVARGSNLISGKDLLTIISLIPDQSIKSFQQSINYFCKSEISFNEIKKKFYRDRLMRALGRVIGFRGKWKNKHETWVLCNSAIGEILFDFLIVKELCNENHIETIIENKIIKVKEDLKIPYSFKLWEFQNDVIDEILNNVAEDKRIKQESEESELTIKKNVLQLSNFNILNNKFKYNENSKILESEFIKVLEKLQLFTINNKLIQTSKVVDMFPGASLMRTSKRENGKIVNYRFVCGLEIISKPTEIIPETKNKKPHCKNNVINHDYGVTI